MMRCMKGEKHGWQKTTINYITTGYYNSVPDLVHVVKARAIRCVRGKVLPNGVKNIVNSTTTA